MASSLFGERIQFDGYISKWVEITNLVSVSTHLFLSEIQLYERHKLRLRFCFQTNTHTHTHWPWYCRVELEHVLLQQCFSAVATGIRILSSCLMFLSWAVWSHPAGVKARICKKCRHFGTPFFHGLSSWLKQVVCKWQRRRRPLCQAKIWKFIFEKMLFQHT